VTVSVAPLKADVVGLALAAKGPDLEAKATALPLKLRHAAPALALGQLVVVQPRFAHGHHARQGGGGQQVGHGRLLHAFAVRVHAHAGPDVRMRRRQRPHGGKFLHRGADAQRARDLRGLHGRQHVRQALRQFGEVEMTV